MTKALAKISHLYISFFLLTFNFAGIASTTKCASLHFGCHITINIKQKTIADICANKICNSDGETKKKRKNMSSGHTRMTQRTFITNEISDSIDQLISIKW
ncbi:hypothetical protein LOAG_14909 [Loa loa]|uniref:Secreted protein n=1 Tax=Loa loa TaxID=7209 RepID=A0A1S0THT1_LOALO|nr:hypothetical protein LOAG_14909 [Loa loa]EFO13619.1 hypothetical protein LOAG_14909 [Loa loa]